jgi:hypothetical protein
MRLLLTVTAEAGCVFLLALWLLLTIANQFNARWLRYVRGFDLMMLIPRWTFFAPNPGLSDFHLSYRIVDADGRVSAWEEIDGISQRSLRAAVWNPDKRVTKAVIEMASVLVPLCRHHPARVADSVPYRCALNHATRAAARAGTVLPTRCEFRLAETPPRAAVIREPFEPFVYQSTPVLVGADDGRP